MPFDILPTMDLSDALSAAIPVLYLAVRRIEQHQVDMPASSSIGIEQWILLGFVEWIERTRKGWMQFTLLPIKIFN